MQSLPKTLRPTARPMTKQPPQDVKRAVVAGVRKPQATVPELSKEQAQAMVVWITDGDVDERNFAMDKLPFCSGLYVQRRRAAE